MIKKRIVILTAFFALVVMLGFIPLAVVVAESDVVINEDISKAVGNLEILRDTTVNGDVTLNMGELNVLGRINGNVNSNMGQVNIDGEVSGDVETNMGQVVVNGNVGGNVRARMGEIIVDGSVGANLISDMGAIRVGGAVGGDIVSGVGDLLITGAVAGDVNSKAGNLFINGIVEGDVTLDQGVVELGPNAIVSGQVYVGRGLVKKTDTSIAGSIGIGEELSVSEIEEQTTDNGYRFDGLDRGLGERIAERVAQAVDSTFRNVRFMPHMTRGSEWPFFPFPFMGIYGNVAMGIINMLIMFALAALTYTLFPKQVKAAGNAISLKTGPVIGWGILAAVLAVPLMVILAITIIGIPLILIEIIFLAVAAILGYSGIVSLIGGKVLSAASYGTANPLGAIALGVLIIGLISMIPLLGSLVSFAVFVLAVGAALVSRFGSIPS